MYKFAGLKDFVRKFIVSFFLLATVCDGLPALADEKGNLLELKIALIPIIDTFPFHVAETEGYFSRAGISVRAIPVISALERDQLMQVGEIDGMLNEISSTASFNRDNVRVRIVGTAREPTKMSPLFRILGTPGGKIINPKDLAGVPIAVAKNTIIDYVTEKLLVKNGLKKENIITESVPSIPERYQLLMQKNIKAATLPDPLAESALEAGARLIIDDRAYPRYSVSVLSFSEKSIRNKRKEVEQFLKAWNMAVDRINKDPESLRSLFFDKIQVPENIKDRYQIPVFPAGKVPERDQWNDVMEWMIEKGLLKSFLAYSESVTDMFPK